MIGSSAREISCSRSYEKGRPRDEDACSAPKKTRGGGGRASGCKLNHYDLPNRAWRGQDLESRESVSTCTRFSRAAA